MNSYMNPATQIQKDPYRQQLEQIRYSDAPRQANRASQVNPALDYRQVEAQRRADFNAAQPTMQLLTQILGLRGEAKPHWMPSYGNPGVNPGVLPERAGGYGPYGANAYGTAINYLPVRAALNNLYGIRNRF